MVANASVRLSNEALQHVVHLTAKTARPGAGGRLKAIVTAIRLANRWQRSHQTWEIPRSELSKRKRALSATLIPLLLVSKLVGRPFAVELTETRPHKTNERPRFGVGLTPLTFRPGLRPSVTWRSIPARSMSTTAYYHARHISDASFTSSMATSSNEPTSQSYTNATEESEVQYEIQARDGSSTPSAATPAQPSVIQDPFPQGGSAAVACGTVYPCVCRSECPCWRSHGWTPLGLRGPHQSTTSLQSLPNSVSNLSEGGISSASPQTSMLSISSQAFQGIGEWALPDMAAAPGFVPTRADSDGHCCGPNGHS